RTDDREPVAGVTPAPRVTGGLGLEGARDAAEELSGAGEPQSARRSGLGLPGQRRHDLRLDLRADPGHLAEAARGGGLPQLAGGADVERPGDVDRAPGAQPQVAGEADQVGYQVALELGELRDLPRRHELSQPSLDPRPDPAKLATTPG